MSGDGQPVFPKFEFVKKGFGSLQKGRNRNTWPFKRQPKDEFPGFRFERQDFRSAKLAEANSLKV
jgi:hypothetical protein